MRGSGTHAVSMPEYSLGEELAEGSEAHDAYLERLACAERRGRAALEVEGLRRVERLDDAACMRRLIGARRYADLHIRGCGAQLSPVVDKAPAERFELGALYALGAQRVGRPGATRRRCMRGRPATCAVVRASTRSAGSAHFLRVTLLLDLN